MNTSAASTSGATGRAAAAERVPTTWSAADEQFFRIARDLFEPAYVAGASVLLGGYDDA